MQLKQDTELQNGKYRIICVLGQGGFGITYLAENVFFGKTVAIKEFFPKNFCGRDNTSHLTLGTANNAETVEKLRNRFMKEAKNIAKLDHPGIVKIHDIFEENNTAYYVMDYIDGENLNEMVKRNGPLSETKAVEYIRKVGDALDYIHSRNMTHFDVKPANIVVRKSDDMPILIDFGLSKQYDIQGDATSTLMQGVSNGYSPIELYNMGSIATFSPQTDVYSLGATFYFLLTGNTPPTASELLENNLDVPNYISDAIQTMIRKSMNTFRKYRWKSIDDFLSQVNNPSKIDDSENILSDYESEQTVLMSNYDKSKNINLFSDSTFKIDDSNDVGDKKKSYHKIILGILFLILTLTGFFSIYKYMKINKDIILSKCLKSIGGFENDYAWIDLGLPSGNKWGLGNCPDSWPLSSGDYVIPLGKTDTVYDASGNMIINIDPDPKTLNDGIGKLWSIPSMSDYLELLENCKTSIKEDGIIFEGKNGNQIYLPLAGYMSHEDINADDNHIVNFGKAGYYYTSEGLIIIDNNLSPKFVNLDQLFIEEAFYTYRLVIRSPK